MTGLSSLYSALLVSLLLVHVPSSSCLQESGKTAATATPSQKTARTVKDSFDTIEVDLFENQKESQFPGEYLVPLQKEIAKQLVKAKAFREVVMAGQAPAIPNVRVLRLTGLITNYKPGSRAVRYMGLGGVGAAEIDSKVSFVDSSTGEALMSQDLRALLTGGAFGGKSEDALKDYARQIVIKVKLMQNLRVPEPGEVRAPIVASSDTQVASSAPLQTTVPLTDKDWVGSEQKLNQEARDGYRLTGLTITGTHTAEAAMVRTNAIADEFEYKLLRTLLSKNLQKDISKLAAEGFRVSPDTLVVVGNNPVVVMERSTPAFKSNYAYILKETMRVSSGQKEAEKIQGEGYTLIGETEHGGMHILLFEKMSPAS